uniref:Uncharacterized protein n=1 Tax=viral metagenome TaxID=1070528 RepID=A0A6H2A142_9ZZZZ
MVNLSKKATAGIAEGDYTTWTYKWTNTVPVGMFFNTLAGMHIDDLNDIISLSWYSTTPAKTHFARYNIADFSAIFESPADADYATTPNYREYEVIRNMDKYTRFAPASSLQTYLLLARLPSLEVWRGSGGTPIWSRNITLDEATIVDYIGYSLSATGKYIGVFVYTTDDWTASVMLYEGG